MKDLILLGASGLAREVLAMDQASHRVIGILDDDQQKHGTRLAGVEVLGSVVLAAEHDTDLLVCIGAGGARRRVVLQLASLGIGDDRYATLIDASVRVHGSCTVGPGAILLAGVVMTADVSVGRHVVAMPNVVLTHDDRVSDFATLAAGVLLGGAVTVGEAAYLGMNASVRPNVSVGPDAVIGMGAVVLSDVPATQTWAGIPARNIRLERAA
jgi:sugar O-acyltransferase (sialic acid O-acetyltransferase NeuD family)